LARPSPGAVSAAESIAKPLVKYGNARHHYTGISYFMKKGCLIAVAVAFAIGLIFVGVVIFFGFALTSGVTDAGQAFVTQIGSGKTKEAYDSASETLKSLQTPQEFEESVKKLGLTDYASVSWGNRQMENDRGQLDGTVITHSGGKIPLHVELIKESGKWKVVSLNPPEAGVGAEQTGKTVPSAEKLNAMALESLLAFNKAVKEKSFVAFQEQGSRAFRQQLSPEKLLQAFKVFVDQGIDISSIVDMQPVFDNPPAINSDGVLILKGSYPTKPQKVVFELKYVFEGGGWRVQGIDVNIPELAGKHPVRPLPTDEKLKEMASESLMAFNKAVQDKSFAAFREECSAQYREQISVEKLNEAFKEFMEKGVDISGIEKVDPAFDPTPKVDSDGVLVLSGSYPGKPTVTFKLKYVFEDDAWKIFGINVDVS
jgi:hypothetical protein